MVLRKAFVQTPGIAVTSIALMPYSTSKFSKVKSGLGLHTVRNNMIKNPSSILLAIADMGYNWIKAGTDSNCLFYNI